MAARFDTRSAIVQTLFECEFRGVLNSENAVQILERDLKDFLNLDTSDDYGKNTLLGVILKVETLDEIIQKAAPEWPLHKISLIDKSILRLGIYELLFGKEFNIPGKVAINEAIELAKAFGGDPSRKFVNGVLGSIYRELNTDSTEGKEMIIEKLVGALMFKEENSIIKYALILDLFKHWTLPKSHIIEGESDEDAVIRTLKDETSADAICVAPFGENIYTSENKEKFIRKQVNYYIATIVDGSEIAKPVKESINDVKWFTEDEIKGKIKMYKDLKPIALKGVESIRESLK